MLRCTEQLLPMSAFFKSCFFQIRVGSNLGHLSKIQLLLESAMKCPACPDVALTMTDRQGIEIDYCPQCRGVWLDRGELDKLIERAATVVTSTSVGASARQSSPDFVDSDYNQHRGGYVSGQRGDHNSARKKSWLNSIFD
jgi:uncharacterized protein